MAITEHPGSVGILSRSRLRITVDAAIEIHSPATITAKKPAELRELPTEVPGIEEVELRVDVAPDHDQCLLTARRRDEPTRIDLERNTQRPTSPVRMAAITGSTSGRIHRRT